MAPVEEGKENNNIDQLNHEVYHIFGLNPFSVQVNDALHSLDFLIQDGKIDRATTSEGLQLTRLIIDETRESASLVRPQDVIGELQKIMTEWQTDRTIGPDDQQLINSIQEAISDGSIHGVVGDILGTLRNNPLQIKDKRLLTASRASLRTDTTNDAKPSPQLHTRNNNKSIFSPQFVAEGTNGIRMNVPSDLDPQIITQINMPSLMRDNRAWGLITAVTTTIAFYSVSIPSIWKGLNSATETSYIGAFSSIGLNAAETALLHAFAHPELLQGYGISEQISKYGIASLLASIYALDIASTFYQFSRGGLPPDQLGRILTWTLRGLGAVCAGVLPEISSEIALYLAKSMRNKPKHTQQESDQHVIPIPIPITQRSGIMRPTIERPSRRPEPLTRPGPGQTKL